MREANLKATPFVDAHIHLWDLERLRYPWLTPPFSADGVAGSVETIAKTYLVDEYRADLANWSLAGAVHVDAGAHPDDALAETTWLEGMADASGLPSGIVAFAPLNDPQIERLLERQAAHPRVRGVRHIINWHPSPAYSYTPRDLLEDPAWERGFASLARHRLSFDLQAYPHQFAAIAAIAARRPDVPVIINHCGMPLMAEDEGFEQWREGLKRLAALPQTSLKISGFGIVDHAWSVQSIRPYVLEAIAMFGPERCMFASDVPTDKLYRGVDGILGAYDQITGGASDDERRALFGGNANRLYRLGLVL